MLDPGIAAQRIERQPFLGRPTNPCTALALLSEVRKEGRAWWVDRGIRANPTHQDRSAILASAAEASQESFDFALTQLCMS